MTNFIGGGGGKSPFSKLYLNYLYISDGVRVPEAVLVEVEAEEDLSSRSS